MPCTCAVRGFLDAKNEDYSMKSTWRVLLGFLLAPLITPLTFLEAHWGTIAAPVLILVGYFAYGSAVIFGGPAFLTVLDVKTEESFVVLDRRRTNWLDRFSVVGSLGRWGNEAASVVCCRGFAFRTHVSLYRR